jgi:hypothetical protein
LASWRGLYGHPGTSSVRRRLRSYLCLLYYSESSVTLGCQNRRSWGASAGSDPRSAAERA